MANIRQYIGARYTIKIYENSQDASSAEWEANTSYEPLVMVTYNNSSYLSKKDVPATIGNPAQNPLYWIVTGAYNGQIAALQSQIDDINNNKLPAITAQIQGLSNDVESLSNKIINDTKKNTVVLIGDSWFSNIATIPAYIQAHYNCTLKNYSVAGTGFDVSNGYKDQLRTMAADTTINLDDIKFVIISAGLNDHSRGATAAEFTTMFNEWKDLYDSIFDGHELPPVYWFADYSIENEKVSSISGGNPTDFYSQYIYYRTVARSIKNIHSSYGFALLPGTSAAWQTANWRHPNEAGGTAYAENICKIIDGVPHIDYVYQEIEGTVRGTTDTMTFRFFFRNGEVECFIKVKESVLASITEGGLIVDLPHKLPTNIPSHQSIGCGVLTGNYNYDSDYISFVRSTANVNVLYAGSSGIHEGKVVGTNLI